MKMFNFSDQDGVEPFDAQPPDGAHGPEERPHVRHPLRVLVQAGDDGDRALPHHPGPQRRHRRQDRQGQEL